MADLDDFFAKKDRKKPKGKKFTTTEEIAKKLEEKKIDKPKKDKVAYQSLPGQNGKDANETPLDEEEEWKEFEEEKKDYTGLKIQNLSLQNEADSESDKGDEDGDLEENEQGEMVRRKKGPWKAIETDGSAAATDAVPQAAPETVPAPAPAPAPTGKYVPPSLRNQPATGGVVGAPLRTPRGHSKAAPDIMNTEYFPTLSASTNETPASWGRKRQEGAFEEVRNSKSHSNRGDSREIRSLEIGNKFGALQSENS